ncbi:T9SS type A sorting domain-containing protein [uncultured Kordia sp.]|uniref:T9SS type A sorting domain-containing protein n=1 Tax=uncultured Kordia sp. TaxID=507699 RepID=UPI00260805B5|nr:T9SS type A sorting domain-containing protein [uncultured Kordia sp.]
MNQKITLTTLLFCIFQLSFGQYKYVQIELMDESPTIGAYIGAPTYYYNMPAGATDYSNDAGLNAILMGNNVTAYDDIESTFMDPNLLGNRTLVVCNNCDNNQLATELLAYSSVIKNAYPLDDRYSYNELYIKINDVSIGIPTGTSNGVITTNDTGLNAIFVTHNVYFYRQLFPSSMTNSLLRSYGIACECDATLLKADLDVYTAVIEVAEPLYIESQTLLSTTEFAFSDVQLYPNPTSNTLNINNTSAIKSLEIYSVQGQLMLQQKSQFETVDMSQLQSGLYFVTLKDTQNRSKTFKIAKN